MSVKLQVQKNWGCLYFYYSLIYQCLVLMQQM